MFIYRLKFFFDACIISFYFECIRIILNNKNEFTGSSEAFSNNYEVNLRENRKYFTVEP